MVSHSTVNDFLLYIQEKKASDEINESIFKMNTQDFHCVFRQVNQIIDFKLTISFSLNLFNFISLNSDIIDNDETKNMILDFAIDNVNSVTTEVLTKTIIFILKKGDWKKLYRFILNCNDDKNDFLRAYLLSDNYLIVDSNFLKKSNMNKVKDIFSKLIKSDIFIPKVLLVRSMLVGNFPVDIIVSCLDEIWSIFFDNISNTEYNYIIELTFKKLEGLHLNFQPKCICSCFESFRCTSNVQDLFPVIYFYRYLDTKSFAEIIEIIVKDGMSNDDTYKILDKFHNALPVSYFPKELSSILDSIFSKLMISKKFRQVLLLLASFGSNCVHDGKREEFIIETLSNAIKGNIHGIILCYVFRIMYNDLQDICCTFFNFLFADISKQTSNEDTYKSTIFYLIDNYKSSSFCSLESFFVYLEQLVIHNFSFCYDYINKIFQYINSSNDELCIKEDTLFSKLEFSSSKFANSGNTEEVAMGIIFLCLLIKLDRDGIEDLVYDAICKVELSLNENNVDLFSVSSTFLLYISKHKKFSNSFRNKVFNLLDHLISIAKGFIPTQESIKHEVSVNLCKVISAYDERESATKLCEFYIGSLSGAPSSKEVANYLEYVTFLKDSILPSSAVEIYSLLCKLLSQDITHPNNTILRICVSFLKRFKNIPMAYTEAIINRVLDKQNIKSDNVSEINEDPEFFSLIKAFIGRYKQQGIKVVEFLINNYNKFDSSSKLCIIKIFKKALTVKMLEKYHITPISNIVAESLSLPSYEVYLPSVKCISYIYRKHPQFLDMSYISYSFKFISVLAKQRKDKALLKELTEITHYIFTNTNGSINICM